MVILEMYVCQQWSKVINSRNAYMPAMIYDCKFTFLQEQDGQSCYYSKHVKGHCM